MAQSVRYLASGKLCGVEFRACTDGERYLIRFEATQRALALLYALQRESRWVDPSEDSGRAWYEIECDDTLLDVLRESVDGCADIVYHVPTFGQLLLFDGEGHG